jgi:CBS domain-containing protein
MLVKEVMHKGLHLVKNDISVRKAIGLMSKFNIGAILVGTPENLEGIFSERDLMVKVVAPDLPVESTPIRDVMTKNILTVQETETIDQVFPIMEKKRIRHLPVVDKTGLCTGMLSSRDLMGEMLKKIELENLKTFEYLLVGSRVVNFLFDLASEKGKKEGKKIVIKHNLTLGEIEDLTNSSRDSLNKVLSDFHDEGLIRMEKKIIVILNQAKLKKKIL